MEQKRFLNFVVCALAILLGWQLLVVPVFFPPPPKKPVVQRPQAPGAEKPKEELNPDGKPDDAAEKLAAEAGAGDKTIEFVRHPHEGDIRIGSLDPKSPYRLQVTLDSLGAVVSQIELTDPLYRELRKPHDSLRVVGSVPAMEHTLQTAIPALDLEFAKADPKLNSNLLDWEVAPGSKSDAGVTFRLTSPDGKLEVLKRFTLTTVDAKQPNAQALAYDLQFELTFKNHGDEQHVVNYELLGPVGLPLEGIDYTRKFRDVVAGFLEASGAVKPARVLPKAIADGTAAGTIEEWKKPLQYLGVDVQYFASLVLPQGDQLKEPYVASSRAKLIGAARGDRSNVSVSLSSVDIELGAAEKADRPGEASHKYLLFAGPKRDALLRPIGASTIIDYGFSGRLGVPQAMLALLGFLQSLFPSWAWPYGWSIILLTVVVRSGMFPFSRKQALSAAKMQEIQPEIAALKKKYGNDTEKFGKAQMDLFRRHNYNPFGGCLVLLVQLPIFMGLWQALNLSVDLRSAKFLWIDDLAAPDALFRFPFALPFLGNEFNLLPVLTVALMFVQQKMFMPPATDKEQELQQKMMSYPMMGIMFYMFYTAPAGLCIYFIASSLWGLAERKLLPKSKKKSSEDPTLDSSGNGGDGASGKPVLPRTTGKWQGGKGKSKQRR